MSFILLWARDKDRLFQSPDTGVLYYYIDGEWHCPEAVAWLNP